MGSLAKYVGRFMARSLESESARILRVSAANKEGLSLKLDGTLGKGHDMAVFGLGTLATWSSLERYRESTAALGRVYEVMEEELDCCAEAGSSSAAVWDAHAEVLRRAPRYAQDLGDLGAGGGEGSPALDAYIAKLRAAGEGDRRDGGGRLLGHLYVRYLADLMGGQVLGRPTRIALGVERPVPRHLEFAFPGGGGRPAYVDSLYASINAAGRAMSAEEEDAVVREAYVAWQANVALYGERPYVLPSVAAAANLAAGLAAGRRG